MVTLVGMFSPMSIVAGPLPQMGRPRPIGPPCLGNTSWSYAYGLEPAGGDRPEGVAGVSSESVAVDRRGTGVARPRVRVVQLLSASRAEGAFALTDDMRARTAAPSVANEASPRRPDRRPSN